MGDTCEKRIYFVGTNLGHAVSNQIHDLIAAEVNLNWRLHAIDSPSLDEFLSRLRKDDFVGAVVTIPHKINVMPHLDRIDKMGSLLGACNNVYKAANGDITGTNTDWIGVRDSLAHLAKSSPEQTDADGKPPGYGKSAFIVVAGGAARAAVYTLHSIFGATVVYVINRDKSEVAALIRDMRSDHREAGSPPSIIHLQTVEEASKAEGAFYGVGTVPDFEPATQSEINARAVFETYLSRKTGVFLDMCYKPRVTKNILAARAHGWIAGDGGQVVGWQLKAQWALWAGKEVSERIPVEKMIENVHQIVERLP